MCMPSMPNMGPQWPNYSGQVPEGWTGGYVRVPTTTTSEESGATHRVMRNMWMDKEGKLWEGPGAGARQTTVSPSGQVTAGQSRGKVADMTPQMAAWLGMPAPQPKNVPEKKPGDEQRRTINPNEPIRMIEPPGWRRPALPDDIKTGGPAPTAPDEPGKYGMLLEQKRAARRKGTRRNVLTLGNPGEVTVVKRVLGA